MQEQQNQEEEYDYKDWQFGFLTRNNFDQALKIFRQGKGHLKSLLFFPWYSDICLPPRFMGGELGLEHLHTKYVPATIVMEVYEVVATIAMMAFVSAKEYLDETKVKMAERLQKKLKKRPNERQRLTTRYEKHVEIIDERVKECTEMFDIVCKTLEIQRTIATKEYESVYRAIEATSGFAMSKGLTEAKLHVALRKARMYAASKTFGMWISETELFYHKTMVICEYMRCAAEQKRFDKAQLRAEFLCAPFNDSIYPQALMRDPGVPLTTNFRVVPYDEVPEKVQKVGMEITEKVSRFLGEMNDRMQKAKEKNIGTENPMELPNLVIIGKNFEPMVGQPVQPVEPGEEDGGVSIDVESDDDGTDNESNPDPVEQEEETEIAGVEDGPQLPLVEVTEVAEVTEEEEKTPEETTL